MTKLKEEGPIFVGLCMSCKKKKILQDVDGLKLCHECEEKFHNELFKDLENKDNAKHDLIDEKLKRGDD